MAFDLTLYHTDKKSNSTARPSDGVTLSCTPRHSISIHAPVVTVQLSDPTAYNYAYIGRYRRYYWITDMVNLANGLWSLSMSEDVLATYRDTIGAAEEYVARSSFTYDGTVQDAMYTSRAGSYVASVSKVSPWANTFIVGTYIVGIINTQTDASSSAVTYYAMTLSEYSTLLRSLQNRTTMASIIGITVDDDGIVQGLTGCLQNITYDVYISQLNPIQYVVSSVYIPATMDKLSGVSSGKITVKLGPWTIPSLTARYIGYQSSLTGSTISIPKHPQAASRGEYLNMPPHSTYSMHFPGFGVIELNGARVGRKDSISYKVVFDSYNGNGYLYLNTDDPDEEEGELGILTGCIGIPVPVTQMLATDLKGNLIANVAKIASNVVSDKGGMMTAISSTGASAATLFSASGSLSAASSAYMAGGLTADMISGAGEAVAAHSAAAGTASEAWSKATPAAVLDGVQSIPTLAMAGSPGGSAGLYGMIWVKNEYFLLVDEDNETLGRPLMQVRKLSTIPGFIKCLDTHIRTGGTAQETEAVNALACAGFFYE